MRKIFQRFEEELDRLFTCFFCFLVPVFLRIKRRDLEHDQNVEL